MTMRPSARIGRAICKVPACHAIVAVLLACGIVERAIWNAIRSTSGASGEAMRVAMAVGRGDGFADAYRLGQGATAHLLPVAPGWAGLIYYLLGVNSPFAEFVLATWSISLAMGTYLILYNAFGFLKVPRVPRLIGLAFGCLMPTYFGQEAVDFRVWDGGMSAFLAAAILNMIVRHPRDGDFRIVRSIMLSAAAAILFFVNPTAGIASITCLAIFGLIHGSIRDYMVMSVVMAAVVSLMAVPWAIRNEAVLGSPVLLRSNAGLELAIGMYPGGLAPADRGEEFMARLRAIHPAVGEGAYARMQAVGGEVAYARHLAKETAAWMMVHPLQVAALALLHVRQTLFPQEWQFAAFGHGTGLLLRTILSQLVGFTGLLGLALGLRRRWQGWIYPAAFIVTLLILGAPFQPVKRYTYLLYPTMIFCSSEALAFAGRKIGPKRRDNLPTA